MIFSPRQLQVKSIEQSTDLYQIFIDFKKAFALSQQSYTMRNLEKVRMP